MFSETSGQQGRTNGWYGAKITPLTVAKLQGKLIMKNRGFTLFELLITVSVITILMAVGLPTFSTQLHNSKLKTNAQNLFESVQLARTKAVYGNKRVTIRNYGNWESGWEIFVDNNNDGERNEGEDLIQTERKLTGVRIYTNAPLREYISFISSGQGRKAGRQNGGAMLIGTMTLCPETRGDGFKLILSSGGRMRVADVTAQQCQDQQ